MSEITSNPPLRKKGLLYYHQLLNAQLDSAFGSVSEAILANTDAINNIIDPDTGLLAQKADKTDIPTSLPADGGNADTLDGAHADEFAKKTDIPTSLPANGGSSEWASYANNLTTLQENGDSFGTSWLLKAQYNKTGDGTFRIHCGDGSVMSSVDVCECGKYALPNVAAIGSNVCLRNLSSGSAAATTSNCPDGAWYGQYEEV